MYEKGGAVSSGRGEGALPSMNLVFDRSQEKDRSWMISNWFEDEAPDFWSSCISRSVVPFTPPMRSHNVVVLVQNTYYGTPVIGAKVKIYRWPDEVHARLALIKQTIETDAEEVEGLHKKFAKTIAASTLAKCNAAAKTIQNVARKTFASRKSCSKRGAICLKIAKAYCELSGRSTMHFKDLVESYYLVSVLGWTIQKAVSFAADKSSSEVLRIVEDFSRDMKALEKVRVRIVASLPENTELVEIVGFPDAKSAEASMHQKQHKIISKSNTRGGNDQRESDAPLPSEMSIAAAMICSLDSDEFGEIRLSLEPGQYVFEISAVNYFSRSIPPFAVFNDMEEDEFGNIVQSAVHRTKVSRCSAFLHPILHNVKIALEREEDGQRLRYENVRITITNSKGGRMLHKAVTNENGVASVRIPSGYYECAATIPDFMSNQQMLPLIGRLHTKHNEFLMQANAMRKVRQEAAKSNNKTKFVVHGKGVETVRLPIAPVYWPCKVSVVDGSTAMPLQGALITARDKDGMENKGFAATSTSDSSGRCFFFLPLSSYNLHFRGGKGSQGSNTYIDHRTTLDVALSHPHGITGESKKLSHSGGAKTGVHEHKTSASKRKMSARAGEPSRRCKDDESSKVHEGLITVAVPLCPSVPLKCLRAILTWDTDSVLDLHVFCFDGEG